MPRTPVDDDLREELILWDLTEKSNRSTRREIGRKNEIENDENIDDKLLQIISTDDIQPLLVIDITNNADNNNHNNENDNDNFISPFAISQNNDKDNPSSFLDHKNEDNQLKPHSDINCNLQVEQLIPNTSNFTDIQEIVIPEKISPSSSSDYQFQQRSQTHSGQTNTNSNSDTQIIINETSNSQISPQLGLNVNPKLSPLATKQNAWETEERNEQEGSIEIKLVDQINLKKDVVNRQISEEQEDQLCIHINDRNSDVEISAQNIGSCCIIL
ncbi:MAG: hypothetical protein EZS28_034071 [Streblomastix strix]|uniref:Uncharacterized protein n=1 Tax=Streblomastix strix TaxID=222440 RepID=A0A5J4UKA0_9EUKA|nr:MAG: hypothetical protein EZS28_034071 [Streblomastix strix]